MEGTLAHGAVVAGRYRLDRELGERDGVASWWALDEILGRPVALQVLDASHPHAADLAEAARAAAAVHDPRFLRVLDAATSDGSVYVVREWVRGHDLATLLASGPLPAASAALLAREVAEAVSAAHAQGLCHLRLDPTTVIVADDGAVKVSGLATEAALHGTDCTDAGQQDALGIGRVLYAGLTGRWPGGCPELPRAPQVDGRLASPRQVRAGVPRALDEVADRCLGEPPRHGPRLADPREVAAALSAVVPPTRGHAHVLGLGEHLSHAAPVGGVGAAARLADSDPTDRLAATPGSAAAPSAAGPATPAPRPAPAWRAGAGTPGSASRAAGAVEDRDATSPGTTPAGGLDALRGFVGGGGSSGGGPPGPPRIPGPRPTSPVPGRPGERRTSRVVGVVAGVLLLVGISLVGFQLLVAAFPGLSPSADTPPADRSQDPPARPSASATATTAGEPIAVVAVRDVDPAGDPPEENPDRVDRATDGDRTTAWSTNTYYDPLEVTKPGVGIAVDLGSVQQVGSVRLNLVGAGSTVELRATPPEVAGTSVPADVQDWDVVSSRADAGENITLRPDEPVRTRHLLVWFTDLPAVEGGFRVGVAEVGVRS